MSTTKFPLKSSTNPIHQLNTDNVYDKKLNKYQEEINSEVDKKVEKVEQIESSIGKSNGIASLDENGKLPSSQLTNLKSINGESIIGEGNIEIDIELFIVVQELPDIAQAQTNKIYLIPSGQVEDQNIYIEYGAIDGAWEKLGELRTTINLEDYYTKKEVDDKLEEALYNILDTNGYDFVDLGEVGIWATCNVGANSPEEAGLYFAWGETKGYATAEEKGEGGFNEINYKFWENGYTKYNEFDRKIVLDLEDDAAHVNMGGCWRMPTKEEFQKLMSLSDAVKVTNYNDSGIDGSKWTIKGSGGKHLFFPNVGRFNGNEKQNAYSFFGNDLYNVSDITNATSLNISSGRSVSYARRVLGCSIRAILDPTIKSPKYLTKQEAKETYQPIGDYPTKEECVTFRDVVTKEKNGIMPFGLYNALYNHTILSFSSSHSYSKDRVGIGYNRLSNQSNSIGEYTYIKAATPSAAGVMSANDKDKLDNLPEEVYSKDELDETFYDSYDPYNGVEYVDMGEAGIWMKSNVGASKPTEPGLYFAWGETKGYSSLEERGEGGFTSGNYKFKRVNSYFEKYNNVDEKYTLDLEDDGVYQNIKGNWRIPTDTEFTILQNLCNFEYIRNYNDSGIDGVLLTLKTDSSKQLFFPKTFYFYEENDTPSDLVAFWTNKTSYTQINNAISFVGNSSRITTTFKNRVYGLPLRGILDLSIPTKSNKFLTKKEADEKFISKEEFNQGGSSDAFVISQQSLNNNQVTYDLGLELKNAIINNKRILLDLEITKYQATSPAIINDNSTTTTMIINFQMTPLAGLGYVITLNNSNKTCSIEKTANGSILEGDNIKITENQGNFVISCLLKEWKGTKEQYDALGTYDDDTTYYIIKNED